MYTGKIAVLKKGSGSFLRGDEWLLYESGCSCQMQHVRWSLNKQHRGLCSEEWPLELGGVTFGKMFGLKTLFHLLSDLKKKNFCKKCYFMVWEDVCLCETHCGEASFRFQAFIFGRACWTMLYYFQGNGHVFLYVQTFLPFTKCCVLILLYGWPFGFSCIIAYTFLIIDTMSSFSMHWHTQEWRKE